MRRTSIALALLIPLSAAAAPKPAAKPAAPAARATAPLRWDAWYTVTVEGKHAGYYNDSVEARDGKIFFKNHFWKQDEGFINEENLGVVSEDDADLRPVFYNFRSLYRGQETVIDGNAHGSELILKIRKQGQEQPALKRSLPPRLIFASVFPVLLRNRLPGLAPGRTVSFLTLLEDHPGDEFAAGRFHVEAPDEFARKTGTTKLKVRFNDNDSFWYVEPNGMPVRIEVPSLRQTVQKVTKAEAQMFLSGSPPSSSR
jgi:hypothetical protein